MLMFWNITNGPDVEPLFLNNISTVLSFHGISLSWITLLQEQGWGGQERRVFFPFRQQLTASVYLNGQSRGGRFTGRVPRGSKSSRSAVHRGVWGRAAELLQLQRSDTRWCCLVFFEHVRYSEIWVRLKGEVELCLHKLCTALWLSWHEFDTLWCLAFYRVNTHILLHVTAKQGRKTCSISLRFFI